MIPEAPKDSHEDDALERQLQARLRDTSPSFEKRFEELQRRLRYEESLPWGKRLLSRFATAQAGWALAGGAAFIALVLLLQQRAPQSIMSDGDPAFSEIILLDETLATAQPLFEADSLEVLLLLTQDNEA